MDTEGLTDAGFFLRLIAQIIDFVLLGMVYFVGVLCAGVQFVGVFNGSSRLFIDFSLLISSTLLAAPFFLSMSYSTLLHAYGGQTIGKALMGIKVLRSNGMTLGYCRSLTRWFATLLSAIPLGAGFFWIFISRKKQTWHDYMAGSRVVISHKST